MRVTRKDWKMLLQWFAVVLVTSVAAAPTRAHFIGLMVATALWIAGFQITEKREN